MTNVERSELNSLREEMREEFRTLRAEFAPMRRQQDQIQGALNLLKWLGPGALLAGLGALLATYAEILRPPV